VEVFEALERANDTYVRSGSHRSLDVRPSQQLVVLTCMDARIDVYATLGLELGAVHVIRTAGGRVTEDALRSLALSTHLLGTHRMAVITHTDCGLHDPYGKLEEKLAASMGRAPRSRDWHSFQDPETAVRADCERLLIWEDRPDQFLLAGYVLNIETGRLQQVVPPTYAEPVTDA